MNVKTTVLIVGTGDHARVIEDLVHAAGFDVIGFVGSPPPTALALFAPILGDLERDLDWSADHRRARFVVAIGANEARRRAFERCVELGLVPAEGLIHPTAAVLGGCVVEAGAQVCAMAMIGVNARIGKDAIVNSTASVDHDAVVAAHAFVGPGVRLAGRVQVGDGAHVGIGAVVREGIIIGPGAMIAAGAVVVADVPANARVAGVPARPMKP